VEDGAHEQVEVGEERGEAGREREAQLEEQLPDLRHRRRVGWR
jgi:hypothetical protein